MEIQSHLVILNLITMNKKNVFQKIGSTLLLLLLVMSLSSCAIIENLLYALIENGYGDILDGLIDNSYEDYTLIETPQETIIKDREGNKAGNNISLLQQKEEEDYEILPSIGEQNVLVIPVYFKDYSPISCLGDEKTALTHINTAFFGDSYSSNITENTTGWESVKSYYYKSSYGKFNLGGQVTSWCPLSKTLKEVASLSSYNDPSIWVLREAVSWFKENYPNQVGNYDKDKDGYIDAVALIYPNEYYDGTGNQSYDQKYNNSTISDLENLLWAYTYWDYENKPNVNDPIANVYTWLSYDFLWDGDYKVREYYPGGYSDTRLVDCQTYIHEFGHVLGLDDYYSYDLGDEPLGRLDMMDFNIGDHNTYSKYLLNWSQPILVEEAGTYTIYPASKEGENNALLIPADINKFSYSPFSEYLLIEFYTPEGLNEKDSKEQYLGRDNDVNTQFIGPNNTPSYSINPEYKLINLISSKEGRNAFNSNYYATNRDLFIKNDFMSEFTFNSGTK